MPSSSNTSSITGARSPRYHDVLLITVMAVLAGCGLIYEYLMAHYAGRILGSVDTTIYAMIGLMIVSMGIGAFYARTIRCPFTGFAWLETFITLIGALSVLAMAGLFAFAYTLPNQLQEIYQLNETLLIQGAGVNVFHRVADGFPYLAGFVLGTMIGMEIPLIARIREEIHQTHLKHNAGTIYGADYIGAGLGAAVWILVCLKLPIIIASVATASVNLVVGFVFIAHYRKRIKALSSLLLTNLGICALLILIASSGSHWLSSMNNMLFKDKVVYSEATKFQNITLTQRVLSRSRREVLSLYINGQLQFASNDEKIYHGMLVQPAMIAAARHEHVLVIGGGDGLAVRDILRWNPKSVSLVELDPQMVKLFSGNQVKAPDWLNARISELTQSSLTDPRVKPIYGDAFTTIEDLADDAKYYDVIIVDLPDPNHPDLNKLYSDYFYGKLKNLLNADGAVVVQSTSPYHAPKAFISIGKTLATAGFQVQQYHSNVPSFGEWGWSIGTLSGLPPKQRIERLQQSPIQHPWVGYKQILGAFEFSPQYYQKADTVKVNHLNTPTLYQYHAEGWRSEKGIFFTNELDE